VIWDHLLFLGANRSKIDLEQQKRLAMSKLNGDEVSSNTLLESELATEAISLLRDKVSLSPTVVFEEQLATGTLDSQKFELAVGA
jgi:hypothetical protein